jgi:hypothetical protein
VSAEQKTTDGIAAAASEQKTTDDGSAATAAEQKTDVLAAAASEQKTNDCNWTTFVSIIGDMDSKQLEKLCWFWNIKVTDGGSDANFDNKEVRTSLIAQLADACAPVESPVYPPTVFGYGAGRLPRNADELQEQVKSCATCRELYAKRVRWGLKPQIFDAVCSVHTFGALFIGAMIDPK